MTIEELNAPIEWEIRGIFAWKQTKRTRDWECFVNNACVGTISRQNKDYTVHGIPFQHHHHDDLLKAKEAFEEAFTYWLRGIK